MKLGNPINSGLIDFDPYNDRTESDPTHDLGALLQLNDGRAFRYGKAGASATSRAKLQLAPAPIANHANLAVDAAAAGSLNVNVTPGATAGAAGIYDEGYMVVNDVDGEGGIYKISHNPAITSSTEFTLALADQIVVALTANSQVTLVHNAYNAFVEGTAATRRAAGVPLVGLAAGDFGWLQTKGVASVLIGSAATLGAGLMADASTAGAVTDLTDVTAPQAEVKVATASIIAGVSTEYNPTVLCID